MSARKSLAARVAAAMAEFDRKEREKVEAPRKRRMQRLERQDAEYDAGVDAFSEAGFLPPGASRAMRDGFAAAERAEFEREGWA